jgi:methionine-rich copper-binding protein CopC
VVAGFTMPSSGSCSTRYCACKSLKKNQTNKQTKKNKVKECLFPSEQKKNLKMRIYTLNFHQLANEYHVTNGLK